MNFREAKTEDLKVLKKHALYPEQVKDSGKFVDYDFVFEHGDYILGMGGFRTIVDGCCWGWIALTEYVGPHLIPTYRCIKEYMDIFCKDKKIRRLQAWVADDFEEGHSTVVHLGFSHESTMENFLGKDKHATLYVRLMEVE